MRLRRFHIDGFGIFQDWGIDGIEDGLTLLVGPNEAGKSTLLQFLRWMLFGHHENRVPALRGQDGGRLWFEVDGKHYRLGRVPYRAQGSQVSLSFLDGTRVDESQLPALLGHCDRAMFESVFAFTQFDLNSFKHLNQDQIRGRLFSAGVAGAGADATAVLARLEAERNQLLAPRSGQIRELLKELDEARTSLQAAREAARGYPQAFGHVESLAKAIESLAHEARKYQQEYTDLDHLLALWPTWLEARRVDEELAALPDAPAVPEGARARLEELARAVSGWQERLAEAEEKASEAQQEVRRCEPDPILGEIAEEVTALAASLEGHRQNRRILGDLEFDQKRLQAEIGQILAELGWSREQVLAFDRSLPVREEVRSLEERLAQARTLLAEANRIEKEAMDRLVAARGQHESALASLEGLEEPPGLADLERHVDLLRTLRAQILERDRLASVLQQAEQTQRDLESARKDHDRASAALASLPPAPDPAAIASQSARLRRLRADMAELERLAVQAEKIQDLLLSLTEIHRDLSAAEETLAGEPAPPLEALGERRRALRRARSRLAEVLRARDLAEAAATRAREAQDELIRARRQALPRWAPTTTLALALLALAVAVWAHGVGHGDLRMATALLGAAGLAIAALLMAWQQRFAADLSSLARRASEAAAAQERADGELKRLVAALTEERIALGLGGSQDGALDALTLDEVEARLEADWERRLRQDGASAARQGGVYRFASLATRAGLSGTGANRPERESTLARVGELAEAARKAVGDLQAAMEALAREAGLDGSLAPAQLEAAERQLTLQERAARDRELAAASLAQAREHFAAVARVRQFAFEWTEGDFDARADAVLAAIREANAAARQALETREAEVLALASAAGLPGIPAPLDLEHAVARVERDREARRAFDERVAAEARARHELEAAQAAWSRALEAVEEAQRTLGEAEAAWTGWKAERMLPGALSPDGAIEYCDRIKEAQERIGNLAQTETRLADCRARCLAFEARLAACLASSGSAADSGSNDPIDAFLGLAERVRADQALRASRRDAELRHKRLLDVVEERKRALAEARSELEELCRKVGAADEASFAEILALAERRKQLQAEAAALADRIAARIGRDDYARRLIERLATGEKARWEADRALVGERIEAIARERDALAGELRLAREYLAALESSADVPRLELELAGTVRKLTDAIRRHRLVSYAHRLIADSLRTFERERQPAVLQRASGYLRLITGGSYQRLNLASDHRLVVADSRDIDYDPDVFSVGTRQQLYLGLRLALAENLAENGTDLPMVMDDVFVNFDPERAAAMARVLDEFVARRQVFVFTCHPETADLLESVVGETRRIDLPRYSGASGPVGPSARIARVPAAPRSDGEVVDVEATEKVMAYLAGSSAPQLKVEIVAGTGLPEIQVSRAIAQLREAGAVAAEGRGPGTRYKLAATPQTLP